MNRKMVMALASVGLVGGVASADAATVVYTDRAAWEAAMASFTTETFDDGVLDAPVSAVTHGGTVVNSRWQDRLEQGYAETTFSFAGGVFGFGADWDLAGPGGTGTGIKLSLDGVAFETEISSKLSGGFWGLISDTAFTNVLLQIGTQSAGVETYHLDNLSYGSATTVVPTPAAFGAGMTLLAGAALRRRRA